MLRNTSVPFPAEGWISSLVFMMNMKTKTAAKNITKTADWNLHSLQIKHVISDLFFL